MTTTPTTYGHLLGTRWRNKRSGHEYRVTEVREREAMIYLQNENTGGKPSWKYAPHLPFDYEEIKDAQ